MAQNPVASNDRYISCNVLLPALGTAKAVYVPAPCNGIVRGMDLGVNVAVDGDNVVKASIAGTDITGLSTTLTTAHVAGTVKCANSTAANAVKRGQAIKVETDGGGGAGEVVVTLLIEQD
jgi:hypothetical protein